MTDWSKEPEVVPLSTTGSWRYAEDITEPWESARRRSRRRWSPAMRCSSSRTRRMRARRAEWTFAGLIVQRYWFEDGRVIRWTKLIDVERAIADFEAGRPPNPRE